MSAPAGGPAAGAGASAGRAPRVALVNLGCRVNRVELDAIAASLQKAGCELVPEPDAEAVVVNTCAVTGEAEAKARKAVRRAAALPQAPVVVATGCVANLFVDELAELGDRVVVEPIKGLVPARVLGELGWSEGSGTATAGGTPTGRTRPGVKIQDGCDNRCTYCIVWKARGAARSLPRNEALAQVLAEVDAGAHEVVLTGINLGRYSDGGFGLAELLDELLERTDGVRYRLSSIEPPEVTPALLSVMGQSGGMVAPFLHLPVQSGSAGVLKRMGRLYTPAEYLRVVDAAREAVPGIAVACDIIAGFPGETDEEHVESVALCRRAAFANMHVFRYSRRPGTPAAASPDQVDPRVIAARASELRGLARDMRRTYVAARVGQPELVLVEGGGKGVTGGLVECLVPDGIREGSLVSVTPHAALPGSLLDAR